MAARAGHTESHILRNYVTAKSVEEVIVGRKAQQVQRLSL
eukprot:SAG22_NODE_8494_length_651_cov_1.121377_2_plen_39_part_01